MLRVDRLLQLGSAREYSLVKLLAAVQPLDGLGRRFFMRVFGAKPQAAITSRLRLRTNRS